MGSYASTQRLNVAVRDEGDALLPGAEIEFEVGGAKVGEVSSTDGRADITRPADDTRPIGVKVTYGGQTQSANVAAGQSLYTFHFAREPAVPAPSKKTPWRTIFVLATIGAGAAASVWLVVRPDPPGSGSGPGPGPGPVDPIQQITDKIALTCAAGRIISNESAIKSGLNNRLNNLFAGAKVTKGDVGAITSIVKPDDVGLKFYKTYTDCLQQQTESYLRLRGVQVVSGSGATSPAEPKLPGTGTGSVASSSSATADTWVYYEELDGAPTKDGVLMPPGSKTTVPYGQITVGTVLKGRKGFKIRDAPKGNAEVLEEAHAGKCVKVVSPPKNPVPVGEASSGGYLRVARVACP
jgi:hypothetical protein